MFDSGEVVHLERVVDDDASTLTALAIYPDGSTTAYTLLATDHLVITDILITVEAAGDVVLVADTAAAGKYIVSAGVAAGTVIAQSLATPYTCPVGVVPKFSGSTTLRSTCILQARLIKA